MSYDVEDLVAHLRRVDVAAETAARVRSDARAVLRQRRSARGRVRVCMARVYGHLLEPALLVAAGAISLSWAVSRILYITGH